MGVLGTPSKPMTGAQDSFPMDRRMSVQVPSNRTLNVPNPMNFSQPDFANGAAGGTFSGAMPDMDIGMPFMDVPGWQWLHEESFLQQDPALLWGTSASGIPDYSEAALAAAAPVPVPVPTTEMPPPPQPQVAPIQTEDFRPPGSRIPNKFGPAFFTPKQASPASPTDSSVESDVEMDDEGRDGADPNAPRHVNGSRTYEVESRPAPTQQPQHDGIKTLLHVAQSSEAQSRVVEELIAFARERHKSRTLHRSNSGDAVTFAARGDFWRTMSEKVQAAFYLNNSSAEPKKPHLLSHYLNCYFDSFHSIWVLFDRPGLDFDSLHPILYLVLTSIGANYDGQEGQKYGSMMHEALRTLLTAAPYEFVEAEKEPFWFIQALILTQLCALYFGQRRAFTFAQHLGCILVTQSRRMNLFSANRLTRTHPGVHDSMSWPEQERAIINRTEAKRRLTFGIYRVDIYMTVLLNTRPIMSYEEIEMETLSCLHRDAYLRGELYRAPAPDDRKTAGGLRYCDLMRIALERDEDLPYLDPIEHELLLYGLQQKVWEICFDPDALTRLTGEAKTWAGHDAETPNNNHTSPSTGSAHHDLLDDLLEGGMRQMKDLRADRQRIIRALQKWKSSFLRSQSRRQDENDRGSVLSSLQLYHLTYLRLHAPVENLHLISYCLDDERNPEQRVLDLVRTWVMAPGAATAVEHACHIYTLIQKEVSRSPHLRGRFNVFAYIGLHHASVVIWTYAGTHPSTSSPPDFAKKPISASPEPAKKFTLPIGDDGKNDTLICRENSSVLLKAFARLYERVSPAWALTTSFKVSALRMANHMFPEIAAS